MKIDYLRPIIADGDTGFVQKVPNLAQTFAQTFSFSRHGGLSSVMKLAKLFVESGAAAIHLEDQLHGSKKCGHQRWARPFISKPRRVVRADLGFVFLDSGKVVVPTSDHIQRLVATRLQWDILGSDTLLIARTDAESSKLLSSNVDARE